jgi:pimeloyl-ACP methyl ester carboxylesterase
MVSHLLVTADGAQLEVLVDGRAADPGLVLLPSSQRDSLDFDELVRRLAGHGFCVLRPQPRGMGQSSPPPPDFTLHTLAADVAQTIRSFASGPAFVAGHAFGHFVARVTDLDHASLVRGVIIIAGAARSFPSGLTQALDIAADRAQPREQRLQSLRHAFFAEGNDASVWLEGWHPHLRERYRRAAAVPAKDCWWPVTRAPILDLQGAEDPWRPPSTRDELRDCLGEERVTVRTIAGASHALIPEQPAAVADAIAAWAGTLRPPSP